MPRSPRNLVFDPIRLADLAGGDESDSFRRRWRALAVAAAAGALAHLLSACAPFEAHVLVQATAAIAGVVLGSPVTAMPEGFALPAASVPVLVSTQCSGGGFFVLVAVLLGWHLAARPRHGWRAISTALILALPLTLVINAARVACVAQAHRWLIPLFPPAYESVLHFGTGVAVFVPSLIALNLALERHVLHRPRAAA